LIGRRSNISGAFEYLERRVCPIFVVHIAVH
jgi:hypothetical protein